jgi:hypothetical protein
MTLHTVQLKDGTIQTSMAKNCDETLKNLGIEWANVSYVSAEADDYSSDYPYDDFDFNR